MGFLIFTILLTPAMLLYVLVQKTVELLIPILAPLEPFLEFLLTPAGFNTVMGILLVVNLPILAVLLVLLISRKRAGKLDRAYTDNLPGAWRFGAVLVNLVLVLGTVWEFIVGLLCALCLVIQPLQYFPVANADPQQDARFLWGAWEIVSCAAVTPSCSLSQAEIDGYIGVQLYYTGYDYMRNDVHYYKTSVLSVLLDGDTDYNIKSLELEDITAGEFEAQFQLSLSQLGCESSTVTHIAVQLQEGDSLDVPGQELFSAGDFLWLYHQGALFRLEEALYYGGPLQ